MADSCRFADALGSDTPVGYLFPPRVPVRYFSITPPWLGVLTSNRRHLLGTGKEAEARKVIAQLNGVPEDDLLVIELMEELEFGIKVENEGGKATWLECFSTRNMLWKRTLNGMMLQFIQQLNGQNFYCKCFHHFHLQFLSMVQTTTVTHSSRAQVLRE